MGKLRRKILFIQYRVNYALFHHFLFMNIVDDISTAICSNAARFQPQFYYFCTVARSQTVLSLYLLYNIFVEPLKNV